MSIGVLLGLGALAIVWVGLFGYLTLYRPSSNRSFDYDPTLFP